MIPPHGYDDESELMWACRSERQGRKQLHMSRKREFCSSFLKELETAIGRDERVAREIAKLISLE